MRSSRLHALVFASLVVLAIGVRLAIVAAWHVPAGDGHQYYALSQELRAHGRYAYRDPPAPPAYSRLPGYPMFLAFAAVRKAPIAIDDHLLRAASANVILDAGTAILVFVLLSEWLRSRALAVAFGAAILACPLLVLLSCYGLGESLATFLTTLEIFCVLRGWRGRPILWLVAAGMVAGLGQLVRADAITLWPGVLAAIALLQRTTRDRLACAAAFVACALLVFSPWPLRNLVRFGAPHAEGTEWLDGAGQPLPTGPIKWMRTWCAGDPSDGYINMLLVLHIPLARAKSLVHPPLVDSDAERDRVLAIFDRIDHTGLDAAADASLSALAADRARAHPFRTWVTLPLRRLLRLWSPVAEAELPMRVSWLGLPAHRSLFGVFDAVLGALALVGAGLLAWRSRKAREAAFVLSVLAGAVIFRSLLHAYAVPFPTQRYVAEVVPVLVLFAAFFVDALRAGRAADARVQAPIA